MTKKNSVDKRHASKISQARMAHILCSLALLCFALCVAEKTETEQSFKDLQLQQDSLSWPDKVQDKQDSTKKHSLMDLLYKLSKSEDGMIFQRPTHTDKQEKIRRGLGITAIQTRGAGCRFIFWKSWAAC